MKNGRDVVSIDGPGAATESGGQSAESAPGSEGVITPRIDVVHERVTAGYLRVMGLRLISGDWFTEGQIRQQASLAVVSGSMADRFWPGENPVGRRLSLGVSDLPTEVIGVVGDTSDGFGDGQRLVVYAPFGNIGSRIVGGNLRFVVRFREGGPDESLERMVQELEPDSRVTVGSIEANTRTLN